MTYPEFTKKFKLQSERLSYERKTHFAIVVCKKLYIDYLKFYQENEWGDPDLLLDTIAFIEKLRNSHPDSSIINERLHSIEAITPDTEDFEDASYALNACVAVYETLDLQQNTGQIFKQHFAVAHYNSQKGKDSPAPNAFAGDCTKSRCIQTLTA